MARNRMIKPELWSSKTISKISIASRLMFIGLWNFCDDYGVYLNSDRKILGDIFPLDSNVEIKDIVKWKSELLSKKLIIIVSYNGNEFLVINSWNEHQKVDRPSNKRWIPETETIELTKLSRDNLETVAPEIEIESGELKVESRNILTSSKKDVCDKKEICKMVIDYLNFKSGKKFKHLDANYKFVRGRLADGYSKKDLRDVIDHIASDVEKGNFNLKYFRPQTIFNATNFDSYLNQIGSPEFNFKGNKLSEEDEMKESIRRVRERDELKKKRLSGL